MNKEQSKRRNEIYRIYNMFFGAKLRNSVMRISRDEIKIKVFLPVTPGVIRRLAGGSLCLYRAVPDFSTGT